MGQALRDMLTTPERCRDALRVTLHLVIISLRLFVIDKIMRKVSDYFKALLSQFQNPTLYSLKPFTSFFKEL